MRPLLSLLLLVAAVRCGPDRSQLPPRGDETAAASWLADGAWREWACEAPHLSRGSSPHGPNRVCNNAALVAHAGEVDLPVGAASVKELFADDLVTPNGFALLLKAGPQERYWYVRTEDGRFASGVGVPLCEGCHAAAPDYVFTVVPR